MTALSIDTAYRITGDCLSMLGDPSTFTYNIVQSLDNLGGFLLPIWVLLYCVRPAMRFDYGSGASVGGESEISFALLSEI